MLVKDVKWNVKTELWYSNMTTEQEEPLACSTPNVHW